MRSCGSPKIFAALITLISLAHAVVAKPAVACRAVSLTRLAKAEKSKPTVDWSKAVVESTMKRYPTAQDLGSWGYAKSLYLYGEYLVWKRTGDKRYLQYIKDWVDSHVDAEGNVTNTDKDGKRSEIKFDNLDSMLPGNLLLLLYQETKEAKYKTAADKIRRRFDTYPNMFCSGTIAVTTFALPRMSCPWICPRRELRSPMTEPV